MNVKAECNQMGLHDEKDDLGKSFLQIIDNCTEITMDGKT
jgi:hypothetical protein